MVKCLIGFVVLNIFAVVPLQFTLALHVLQIADLEEHPC